MQLKIGKDFEFYSMLEAQAATSLKASQAFLAMLRDYGRIDEHARILAAIENEGDELTHQLQNRVASTFITPLDKEDLRDLSQALDDITDFIEAAAARMHLYRLEGLRPDLEALAVLLNESSQEVCLAVSELHKGLNRPKTLRGHLVRIHDLENQSDQAFRNSLADLFDHEQGNVLYVIKWKEIYDRIETAIDKCEDVAKIIGTVMVKYA